MKFSMNNRPPNSMSADMGRPPDDMQLNFGERFGEQDPTVPDWAKQKTKPSYTAEEVGAAPAGHDHDDVYQPKGEYLTKHQSLKDYAKKEDVASTYARKTDIPKNVSAFTNDSGYLTEAPIDGKQYARQSGEWSEVQGTSYVAHVLKTGDTYELYETTIEELRQVIEYNSGGVVVRVIDDVAYLDDYVEYSYAGYSINPGLFIFSNVSENISLMYIHQSNGGIMVDTLYNPTTKTDAMTQAVGRDSDGLLWTAPSGGGSGFDIHSLQSENDIISDDELAFYDVSANDHRKISYGWLRSDIKNLLDNYYVKSVNGLKDVVTLKAENIKTNTSGIVAEYKFKIEGEFDVGLIGVLNEYGTQATAAQVIAALNSGKGVQFNVYDQTHSIDYTTVTNFRYLIEGESVNIVFTVARGHYYTPANILVSWDSAYSGWNETEYDRDHDFPTYTPVPDGSYVWNTQELLDRLDGRVTYLEEHGTGGGIPDATLQHIIVKDAYIEAINDPDNHIGGVRISANETNNNFAVLKINSEQTTDTSTVTRTTVVRGVATPVESNDAANKAYVDEKTVAPIRYMGILEDDGTITASSDMKYDSVKSALEKGRMSYILTYRQEVDPQNNHYFILTTNENYFNANAVYFTGIDYIDDNHITYYAIKLNSNNVISTESVDINVDEYEKIINKSTDVIVDKESNTKYPTCKTIYDNFQRRDVLIYDKTSKLNVGGQIVSGDSANGLSALGASGSIADNQWNITGLDLSGFKYIRVIYNRDSANTGSTAEFNIPLDYSIQNNAYFVSGGVSPSFGDRNRMNCMQCAVSGDKTKFAVCQTYSLYGTAATTISTIYVVRIYGVY